MLRQKASLPERARKIRIVCADEEQNLYIFEPCTLHVTCHHLVRARRYDADSCLLKPGIQKLNIFFQADGLISEQCYELVKQIQHDTVYLRVFSCQCKLTAVLEFLFLPLQLNLQILLYHELIDCHRDVPDRFPSLTQYIAEAVHFLYKCCPGMVQPFQLLFLHTFRPSDPFFLPFFIAFDAEAYHIVLKVINILAGKSRKIRAQKAEHALIAESLLDHIEQAPDIFDKGVQQDAALVVHEDRNIVQVKSLFQIVAVDVHIACDNTHFTVSVSLRPHKIPHASGHSQRLLPRISRHMHRHCTLCTGVGMPSIAEQTAFQICHGVITAETGQRPAIQADRFLHLYRGFAGDPHKGSDHLLADCKQLVRMAIYIRILPVIHRDRDDNFPAAAQEFKQQPVLHWCKASKSVQHHRTALQKLRLSGHPAQDIQQLLFRYISLLQIFGEAFVKQADILKLIIEPGILSCSLHHLFKLFLPDVVLGEFRDDRFDFADIAKLLHVPFQHFEPVLILACDTAQDKVLPLVIEHRQRPSPCLLEHTVGQAAEA